MEGKGTSAPGPKQAPPAAPAPRTKQRAGSSPSLCRGRRRTHPWEVGGAEGDRTPDLRNAIATLSQLSYGPTSLSGIRRKLPCWKRGNSPRRIFNLAFVVLGRGLDSEIVVAGLEVDFLVGADLLVLVDRELVGGEIFIRLFRLLRDRSRLERQRLLRLEHRFGHEVGAAFDAVDRVILAEIVKAGRALGASALGAPFGLHHEGLVSSKNICVAALAGRSGARLAIGICPCQSARRGRQLRFDLGRAARLCKA